MKLNKFFVGIAFLIFASLSSFAQTPTPEPKPDQRSQYKVVIFDVKIRRAESVARALVGSGAPGTQIMFNNELKTITVRDYPENIMVIGEAIKRFDVAAADVVTVPDSLELQLHLIAASQSPGEKTTMPPALEKAVAQMKTTLKYSDYRFLTTITSRVLDGGSVNGSGYINPPFPTPNTNLRSNYTYFVERVSIITDASSREAYLIRKFAFNIAVPIFSVTSNMHQFQTVGVQTELSLRDGETAVVGTANVGASDEALIVVVTARKVK